MRSRRSSTLTPNRATANEFPKSIELEQRISRVEMTLKKVQDALDLHLRRINATQAELDYLRTKIRNRFE